MAVRALKRRSAVSVPYHRPRYARPGLVVSAHFFPAIQAIAITLLAVAGTVVAYSHGQTLASAERAVPSPAVPYVAEAAPVAFDLSSPPESAPVWTPPPSRSRATAAPGSPAAVASELTADGIPYTAWHAYHQAAARSAMETPQCHLPWTLLAAIGRVESNHGRFGNAVLHTDGRSTPPVIGIALDGTRSALIRDTDKGVMDGDRTYDRAVGPMQFIPSTWAGYGVDANGDGIADPFNIFDAAAAAAKYLCVAGGDLSSLAGKVRALHAYNPSTAYATLVLAVEAEYAGSQAPPLPDTTPTGPAPAMPPVNAGPPTAVDPSVLQPGTSRVPPRPSGSRYFCPSGTSGPSGSSGSSGSGTSGSSATSGSSGSSESGSSGSSESGSVNGASTDPAVRTSGAALPSGCAGTPSPTSHTSTPPDTSAPDTSAPDSSTPASSAPDSSTPASSAPASSAPDSSAPDSSTPASSAPDGTTPDTSAPGPSAS